jgi:ribosomal protein L37E
MRERGHKMGVMRTELGERSIGVMVSMPPAFAVWLRARGAAEGQSVSEMLRGGLEAEWRKEALMPPKKPIEVRVVMGARPVDARNPCEDCGNKECSAEMEPCSVCGAPESPDRWKAKERES